MDEKLLTNARNEIDRINTKITALLVERMKQVDIVAAWKAANNQPVSDPARENAIIQKVCGQAGEEFSVEVEAVFRAIFAASRNRENRMIAKGEK
jgi:chorismate mutase